MLTFDVIFNLSWNNSNMKSACDLNLVDKDYDGPGQVRLLLFYLILFKIEDKEYRQHTAAITSK